MNFAELQQLVDSFKTSRIIQVAVSLKIFDTLASEKRTADGIAESLSLEPRATALLCNALTGLGLLEKAGSKFANTGVSQVYLVSSSPRYYGWIVDHNNRLWNSWSLLGESIRTGKPPASVKDYEYTKADQEAFIMGMHSIIVARGDAEFLLDRLGLDKVETILDVGGGPATFPAVFCGKYKNLKATVFDLPETLEVTRKNMGKYPEVADRIKLVEGDFTKDPLPKGFDMVFISNIIHSYNEAENQELVKKAAASLNPGGRIVIKDHILNEEKTLPLNGSIFALHMLLLTTGRCYNFNEVSGWLKSAGCKTTKNLDLPQDVPYGIVIGAK